MYNYFVKASSDDQTPTPSLGSALSTPRGTPLDTPSEAVAANYLELPSTATPRATPQNADISDFDRWEIFVFKSIFLDKNMETKLLIK